MIIFLTLFDVLVKKISADMSLALLWPMLYYLHCITCMQSGVNYVKGQSRVSVST